MKAARVLPSRRTLDALARKLVPSVPVLSRKRGLMALVNCADRLVSLPFARYRGLPPNHLRIRVGVGNRLFFNQAQFLAYGRATWDVLFGSDLATPASDIVELGCGCGRAALALSRLDFQGRYTGVDADHESITWCRSHIVSERFVFAHADTYNGVYNPAGRKDEAYRLPLEGSSQDVVFAQSVFTHLLENDVRNYVREAVRVLRPGGQLNAGVFCLDDMRERGLLGGRWTFPFARGSSWLENEHYPEAAVAYPRDFLLALCRDEGFRRARIDASEPQSILVCKR